MENELKELYNIKKKAISLESELENLNKEISEKTMLVITEMCFTDKKLEFHVEEDSQMLQLIRRDYKAFTPDVQFELNKAKKAFEDSIKPAKDSFKNKENDIKGKAEKEGKVKISPRWYLYIKSTD